jgi:hypothetical protein
MWVGSGWVEQLMGWVGFGLRKLTHGQLWYIHIQSDKREQGESILYSNILKKNTVTHIKMLYKQEYFTLSPCSSEPVEKSTDAPSIVYHLETTSAITVVNKWPICGATMKTKKNTIRCLLSIIQKRPRKLMSQERNGPSSLQLVFALKGTLQKTAKLSNYAFCYFQ